jgi:hypothetical protein
MALRRTPAISIARTVRGQRAFFYPNLIRSIGLHRVESRLSGGVRRGGAGLVKGSDDVSPLLTSGVTESLALRAKRFLHRRDGKNG